MPDEHENDNPDEFEEQPYDPEDVDEEGLPKGMRDRLESLFPDLVRKTFAAGLGALFTTEEGIRKLSKEVPMPKEVAGYLASTAGNTKDEVMRIVAREVHDFMQNVNFADEVAKMLTTLSFEVKTEIRFIPNEEKYAGLEPDVKSKVRIKRKRRSTSDDE